MSEFIGTGWAFPVTLDSDGRVAAVSDLGVINRSIELILGTAKGERLMRPDFGSDLFEFVFKPLNHSNKLGMATAVKNALQKWEKRIRLVGSKRAGSNFDWRGFVRQPGLMCGLK